MANYVNYPIGNILRFSIKSYTELFRKAKEGQWFDKNGNIYGNDILIYTSQYKI